MYTQTQTHTHTHTQTHETVHLETAKNNDSKH